MIFLGIDTSNYKTSLAAVNEAGEVLYDISEYLEVPKGERGLRQSDAFFKHSNRLPDLLEKLFSAIDRSAVKAIGVSERPRRVEGSYMPCFLAGINLAKVLSNALEIPLYAFSHQEGHAAAVIESNDNRIPDEDILFMHLSGGTTEILKCSKDESGYLMEIVGGSLDISFGQLLDRFGVALGFPFPSGMFIDRLASLYRGSGSSGLLPEIRIKEAYFNLSGTETRLMRFASDFVENHPKIEISGDGSPANSEELAGVCHEVMDKIAAVISEAARQICLSHNLKNVYIAGGVASSETLREIIANKCENNELHVIFGSSALSGDNAVGTALLARRRYTGK